VGPRARTLAFASAGVLVVAGAICAALVAGDGEVLAIACVAVGVERAPLLALLEVGLSEDRERARDAEPPPSRPGWHSHPYGWPPIRRLPRLTGSLFFTIGPALEYRPRLLPERRFFRDGAQGSFVLQETRRAALWLSRTRRLSS
jgi:hypothetical protein